MELSESELKISADGRQGGPLRQVPADVWSEALTLTLPKVRPERITPDR